MPAGRVGGRATPVDATSQSASGLSSLASSRGGSPAPSTTGVPRRRRGDARATTTLRSVGVDALDDPVAAARRPNTRCRLFLLSSVNVGARTREGEAERAELDRVVTMERVSFWSMLACLTGYLAVGVFAYAEHPDVPSNLLDAYPADDLPMLAASLLMGLSCAASYPINHFASRAALDDLYVAGVCAWKRCFAKTAGDDDSGVTLGVTWARPGAAVGARGALRADDRVRRVHDARARRGRPRVVFQLVGAVVGVIVIFILRDPPAPSRVPSAERSPGDRTRSRGSRRGSNPDGGTPARP